MSNYKITDNTPDNWKIIKDQNGEFKTLKEAKKELIDICKSNIEAEKQMIKEVRKFKL